MFPNCAQLVIGEVDVQVSLTTKRQLHTVEARFLCRIENRVGCQSCGNAPRLRPFFIVFLYSLNSLVLFFPLCIFLAPEMPILNMKPVKESEVNGIAEQHIRVQD